MIVSDLIIHPIKSLNGIHVSAAKICEYGFENDRIFMIVREQPDHSHRLLHIGAVSALALFRTSIVDFNIVVSSPEGALLVPLNPDTRGLKRVYICMAETDLWAYDMGFDYNLFFRKTLGPNVKLLFGGGTRPTAMNKPSHWLFRQKIALHFTAPILLTSASSLADVNKRASSSTDMEKFRPNIVVDGAAAWDEDYWSEVRIAGNLRVPLTAPCNRCRSITVDYITGKFGTAGPPQKHAKLSQDRQELQIHTHLRQIWLYFPKRLNDPCW